MSRIRRGSGSWEMRHAIGWATSGPATLRWIRQGCSGPAPHVLKVRIVKAYLLRFGMNNFIETGTYLGDTLECMAKTGIKCTSFELSPALFEQAKNRFEAYPNVQLILGDSGERLPELMQQVHEPCLLWLDGHYSGGVTALGTEQTPVSREVGCVLAHRIKRHVVLIDDARLFDGTNDYPHLDELLRYVREEGSYVAETSADVIRLIPRELAKCSP